MADLTREVEAKLNSGVNQLSPKIMQKMARVWSVFTGLDAAMAQAHWNLVMLDLKDVLTNRIGMHLAEIDRYFGHTAYVESLNAATNLIKRFLGSSKSTHPYVKVFEVLNQIMARFASLEFRSTKPIRVQYEEAELDEEDLDEDPGILSKLHLGMHISAIEASFDVLARRTGANKDPDIEHVHEVDLAFISAFSGITEAYANPKPTADKLSFQGGGGVGEKVFAVGHEGAVGFREDVAKTEERFYALIMPKGFISALGQNLMKSGGKGASAREPNEQEFSTHKMPALNGDPEIDIALDKMFFIRGEKSTAESGQVDIHFGWRGMIVNDEATSHANFFRQHVLGVIEFTRGGLIIRFKPNG
jgi:hypothetical protein